MTSAEAVLIIIVGVLGLLGFLLLLSVHELRQEVKLLRADCEALRTRHFSAAESFGEAVRELGLVWEPGTNGRWRKK